jgi:hypothetical protein
LDWGDLLIDHMIPESLSSNIDEFEKIKKDFELYEDFSVNEIYNLVPSHSKCNSRKSDDLFTKNTTLYYLSLSYKAELKVKKEIEKIKNKRNKDLIISKLESALSAKIIDTKEIKEILKNAEKNNWNLKKIKLSIPVTFIDEVYDVFYLNNDFSSLLDKKLILNNDEDSLQLVNNNEEKIEVSTVNEWKRAKKQGYYPFTTYAIKTSSIFSFFEDFIEILKKAKMPKVSFIDNPWIDLNMLDYLSPNILVDFEERLVEYTNKGLSIGELR